MSGYSGLSAKDDDPRLSDPLFALRTSDCSTSLQRAPGGSGVLAHGMDNGMMEAGSAIVLKTKVYAGIAQAIITGLTPATNGFDDFRMAVWNPLTRQCIAYTANLAAVLNAIPQTPDGGYLVVAPFVTPVALSENTRVAQGHCSFGRGGIVNVQYACESCKKAIMQIPVIGDGAPFAFRTHATTEYDAGNQGYPIGGYQGGVPGQIGTATPGNYPKSDMLDAGELAVWQAFDQDFG